MEECKKKISYRVQFSSLPGKLNLDRRTLHVQLLPLTVEQVSTLNVWCMETYDRMFVDVGMDACVPDHHEYELRKLNGDENSSLLVGINALLNTDKKSMQELSAMLQQFNSSPWSRSSSASTSPLQCISPANSSTEGSSEDMDEATGKCRVVSMI